MKHRRRARARKKEKKKGMSPWKCLSLLLLVAVAASPFIVWPVETADGKPRGLENTSPPMGINLPGAKAEKEEPKKAISVATDPVAHVIRKIREADFRGSSSVMTGRYLQEYSNARETPILRTTDLDKVRPVSRGNGWMFLEAPYTPPETMYDTAFPWEDNASEKRTVRLRMVQRNGTWKLEHVKLVNEPRS